MATRRYNKDELNEILINHEIWLNDSSKGSKANLHKINLTGLNLIGVNLSYANLREANLQNVNLQYADLSFADLSFADLRGANLKFCNLDNANLWNTKLSTSNLWSADLSNSNLENTDLRYSNLKGAVLSGADLNGTKLIGANLYGTNFKNVKNFESAKFSNDAINIFSVCPEEGEFIGFKKVYSTELQKNVIAKIKIPLNAKRSSATTRKCRTERAEVMGFYDYKKNELNIRKACSMRDKYFIYEKEKTVIADSFDDDRFNECSNGIHFFITFQEAVLYGE